ncbi:NADH-quinone oxidoreductase subunit L [Microbulbifer celer]|uniref:NADH-quinone oxidoreductase subunit L n=1 Tax=Microbulbifer celer TaxID=435905 RepID=A0ABW3U793_9GAMM|nr:NADH-quinone oxidoreductase subunit L [Microbulbifer celer]UFN58024.1 NADH-quinone oxidoreductase subunit L [Microbulbifer celer]
MELPIPLLAILIPLCPLLGFILFVTAPILFRRPLKEATVAVIGIGSVGIAALTCGGISAQFIAQELSYVQVPLWQWTATAPLTLDFAFYLDALTLTMLAVITGVGLLIHIYAAGYMHGDDGYQRFFAYLNLFVFAMTVLVLADSLLLLYLGWEAVGLCSFLLIGFWYRNADNGRAASKAFLVTRVGDTALLVGLIVLYWQFGTLRIQPLMEAVRTPGVSEPIFTLCALLLLAGAAGKSAQVPLQTWLPDAMAGPTPVSALIHAATMVTAGVYLIARCHELFLRSEFALLAVATIGAVTLLIAGCSALVQSDIKRVLAYSTISQLGYMFVALGTGAFSAAIFHLVTHAFFKALLFLAAGMVILHVHHRQSLAAMGGLRRSLPLLCISFAIGCASLAALPLTAGYFSKEEILANVWHAGPHWLWWMSISGAIITGMYSFRLFFRVFCGPAPSEHSTDAGVTPHTLATALQNRLMGTAIVVLSLLALFGGFISLPLESVFGDAQHPQVSHWISAAGSLAPLLGVVIGWFLVRQHPDHSGATAQSRFGQFLLDGWGFDRLYQWLLVNPFLWLSRINRSDFINCLYQWVANTSLKINAQLSRSQNGVLRWYLTTLVTAIILMLLVAIIFSARAP